MQDPVSSNNSASRRSMTGGCDVCITGVPYEKRKV